MIQINLIKPPARSFVRLVAAGVAVAAAAVFLYAKIGADSHTPSVSASGGEQRAPARPSGKTPSAGDTPRGKKGLRATGFVRYAGSEFAMLVSGRKSLWVEKGQRAFGVTVSDIREDGVLVSRGAGTEFFPLKR